MQATVEDYIYQEKQVRVKADVESIAKVMPRRLAINYLKDQLIKLNLLYNYANVKLRKNK